MMKKVLAVLMFLSVFIMPNWALAEAKTSATAELSVQTLNYSRGEAKSRNSMVFLPVLTVGYRDVAFSMSTAFDSSPYAKSTTETNTAKAKDTSLSVAYAKQLNIVKLGFALAYNIKDEGKDEKEASLSVGLDIPLEPTVAVFQTVGIKPETYLTLGISKQVPLSQKATLNLRATAGYLMSQTDKLEDASAAYFRTYDDGTVSNERYSGFLDGVVSAGVAFDLGNGMSVEPFLNYAFPLSSNARNFFKANSQQGFASGSTSHFFGGTKLSLSF
jgi:hypothetical protein